MARKQENGESTQTICLAKTGGELHMKIRRHTHISGEPEVARKINSREIATILLGSHKLPYFRCSNQPDVEYQ